MENGDTDGRDDGGKEERKGIERAIGTHVNDHVHISLPILDRIPKVRHFKVLMLGRRLLVHLQPANHPATVIRRQESRLVREIKDHPERRDTNKHSRQTFKNENPGPAVLASNTAHLANRRSEQTTERPRYSGRGEENGRSDTELAPLVPAREVVINTRKQPRLRQSQEKSRRRQSLEIMHQAHTRHHDTPREHNHRNENAGSESLQQDVGQGFSQGVGDEENG